MADHLEYLFRQQLLDGPPGPAVVTRRQGVAFATIDLPHDDFEPYYGGFCNGALWPLFHYFVGSLQYSAAQHAAYDRVNRLFAERLLLLLRDGDLVWVHDYHLIPLGSALRDRGVGQPLGFFLHIPFPARRGPAYPAPGYDLLVRAMLAYDLVGFQTARDLECFRCAAAEVLGPKSLGTDGGIQPAARSTQQGRNLFKLL